MKNVTELPLHLIDEAEAEIIEKVKEIAKDGKPDFAIIAALARVIGVVISQYSKDIQQDLIAVCIASVEASAAMYSDPEDKTSP